MAVRIKDWMIPYTWWVGIEITNNHVINVLLREMNNLIHVNENRELYVDLQLDDWIEPSDDFPVGVTTGKILEEDWWQQNGIILNRKTTSGDYVRLIYANDGKLYYDPWTWVWNELGGSWQTIWVATASSLGTVKLGSDTVQTEPAQNPTSTTGKTYPVQLNSNNQAVVNVPWEWEEYESLPEDNGGTDLSLVTTWEKYIWNHKQNALTPWNNITIDSNNVISATIPAALTYKGNVNGINDLPQSWNTVWDTYFVEGQDSLYSWDGTQWNYVWWSWIDVTNLFNKTIDDSDDIVQGSLHLFCSPTEKARWNAKQDALTAWANIQIINNVISATDTTYTAWTAISISGTTINNTKPFDPENAGTLAQVLKKTSTWYRWSDEVDWFDPENAGSTGQVLKKTSTGYAWGNEGWWWGGWWGWNFNPTNVWTPWQVLTKTANWYDWETLATWEWNVKLFTLSSLSDTTNAQHVLDWTLAGKMPIIKFNDWVSDVYYPLAHNNTFANMLEFKVYMWPWTSSSGYTYQTFQEIYISYSWTTVSTISHHVEEVNKQWIWTQADYNLLTPVNWVIYNIIPSS